MMAKKKAPPKKAASKKALPPWLNKGDEKMPMKPPPGMPMKEGDMKKKMPMKLAPPFQKGSKKKAPKKGK